MLGLIKKDILLIKKNLKILLVTIIAYSFMSLGLDFDINFMIPFLTIMIFITTFSYDDFNNWHAYAITFPSRRVNIIRSKYITSIIITFISILAGLIISFGLCYFNNTAFNLINSFEELMGILFAIIILISFMVPVIFKFGSEKGRIWIFGIVFCLATALSAISRFIDFSNLEGVLKVIDDVSYVAIPLTGVIILLISYLVSKKIYLHKEF